MFVTNSYRCKSVGKDERVRGFGCLLDNADLAGGTIIFTLIPAELQGVSYRVTGHPGHRTLRQEPVLGVWNHHGEVVLEALPVGFVHSDNYTV